MGGSAQAACPHARPVGVFKRIHLLAPAARPSPVTFQSGATAWERTTSAEEHSHAACLDHALSISPHWLSSSARLFFRDGDCFQATVCRLELQKQLYVNCVLLFFYPVWTVEKRGERGEYHSARRYTSSCSKQDLKWTLLGLFYSMTYRIGLEVISTHL